ncbi:MAG: tetratricopeptide repeat protein [Chloroflexia bacterium]
MDPLQAIPASPSFPLEALLPLDRRQALALGQDLPEHSQGTALLADISGFTPLMEHLANTLGPQQGAEELTRLLNALFAPLIEAVHGYGGQVIAFGGDALTCWFPGEEAPLRAAACALEMQRQIAGFGQGGGAGLATLSMHIGLATGPARRFYVGRPPHGRLEVLAGATMERLAEALGRAESGQIVLDAATAAGLPATAARPLGNGLVLLENLPLLPPPVSPGRLPTLPARTLRRWLAGPLYCRLRSGGGRFAAELRRVAAVFVRFAGLDYDGDPNAGRKLRRYIALAQELLASYGGHLSLVSCGDKGSLLFILFGAPLTHEDDPERAVGFALEFQEAVEALPFIQDQRIGISLGQVYAGILGSEARCTYTVLGDEVNVSARLMEAAAPGQILVSRRVERAAGRFSFRPLGAVQVKGREEAIPVFAPLPLEERRAETAEETLVGREVEKEVILDLLRQVGAGRGHLLQITGEAGVGKSALVRFLLRRMQQRGWPTYLGACLSYGQHTPYLPWRAVLEQACGLTPEMDSPKRVARLKEAVAALPEPPGRPGYWEARFPLLAEAMGLAVDETPLTRTLEGELRRDNTFFLLEALVRHLAKEGPVGIVLEDAYWADELSLLLTAHLGRGLEDIPLLLVVVQRPWREPPEAVRRLQELPGQTTLALSPLARETSLELARLRLHGAVLSPRLEALLQERARGNPFFIEELLRALEEAGRLRRSDGEVELAGEEEGLELPDTIEGLVQARLDRLPEEERLTLKVASVIGRAFQRPLLEEVHPARPGERALARQLLRLERANFTLLEEGFPEWRYTFQHPILHEVTYGTLLFAQRRALHGAIGAALERRYAADPVRVLDALAYHYARSEDREKAVHYLHQAAEKARREYANEAALGYYGQALERLLPDEREKRYELLAGRERIYDLLGEREAQERDLQEMGRLAEALGDPRRRVEVLNRRARRAVDIGEFQQTLHLAQEARKWAEQGQEWAGLAEAQKILAIAHASLGEYEEARHFLDLARELYHVQGDRLGEASCLNNLGLIDLYQGDAERARSHLAQSLELFRSSGDRLQETRGWINLGLAYFYLTAYEEALECNRQALALSREIGHTAGESMVLDNMGALSMTLGDVQEATSHHRQALDLARRLQDREGEATSLSSLGLLSAYQGRWEEARSYLQRSLEQCRAIGHRRGEAVARHHTGVAELWAGNAPAAVEAFREALALREEIGEVGNALVSRAWLSLACLEAGEKEQARTLLARVEKALQDEGYGGDAPEQEVWWAIFRVRRGLGDEEGARAALKQARNLVQEQAGRLRDPRLRRSFLENVPVNREVLQAGV